MYEVKIHRHKNRLYVTLQGFIGAEEGAQAAEAVIKATQQLTPGFTIITDIREFSPMTPETAEHIQRAQLFAFQHGAKKTVRIVKNVISSMQFNRTQKQAGAAYDVLTAHSVEEAERLLDRA